MIMEDRYEKTSPEAKFESVDEMSETSETEVSESGTATEEAKETTEETTESTEEASEAAEEASEADKAESETSETEADPFAPAPVDVRLPRRATIVDADGNKIGKLRKGIWQDEEGTELGVLRREENESVSLYRNDERVAFLDKNDNLVSLQNNEYIATLRCLPIAAILIIVLLLALTTALSAFLSVYYINRSSEPYIPTMFVVEGAEDGMAWEDTENLPIFYNSDFGTDKIAPGMTGRYSFRLSNESGGPLEFSLVFDCVNEYGIDLAYTLYRDGVPVAGQIEKVPAEGLSTDGMTIEEGSDSIFSLEWEWRHNDPVDTEAGENQALYVLNITFNAEAVAS